jgi:hypothetical protein
MGKFVMAVLTAFVALCVGGAWSVCSNVGGLLQPVKLLHVGLCD